MAKSGVENFKLLCISKGKLPSLPFERMKNAVLGKNYILEVAFIKGSWMRALNKKYRNKNEVTDILSFPLFKNEGQIVICISAARTEAKKFDRNLENFIAFLFIHGLAHLKGLTHGSRMEALERKYRTKFGV